MKDEQTSLQQIIDHRNKKLITMKENGINPFPHKFNYSHKSKEILLNFNSLENKCVKVAGRIMAIRKMGKASFAQVLDSEGRIQIFIKKDDGNLYKIASIGVKFKKWVSYHGFSFNLNPNLDHYSGINPCGLNNKNVTSIEDLGKKISKEELNVAIKENILRMFKI